MSKFNTTSNNITVNSPITTTATSYTALLTDYIIEVTNTALARTITLPAPSTIGSTANVGKVFVIKDSSGGAATNNITITPSSGNIDGVALIVLNQNYGFLQVFCDGVSWFSIAALPQNQSNTPTLNVQTFTSSGTYTPSANMQYAVVEIVGGGGGGGGSNNLFNSEGGAGGGSGGYAKVVVSSVQVLPSKSITIGALGSGSTTSGTAGGNSTFGSLITSNGGSGGATAGTSSAVLSAVGGSGGTVTVVTGLPIFTMTGKKGGNFFGSVSATLGMVTLGEGGSNPLGFGAASKSIANNNPSAQFTADASVGYGAGGGGSGSVSQAAGGSGTATGGNGLAGVCIVTEYIFAPPPLVTTASITWNTVNSPAQTMVASQGYYTANPSAKTLTLPAVCAAGTMMAVIGTSSGLWTIAQLAGQSIQYGAQVTTVGTGGNLVASAQGNAVWLVCTVANTTWYVTQSVGNITVN